MSVFAEVIEKISHLSADELEEVKLIVDKTLTEKKFEEIAKALEEARQKQIRYKLKYYETGEDLLASLNEKL